MATVTNLPDKSISFDLDAEERDPKDVKEPFIARVQGRAVTMIDPEEIDWQDLLEITKPTDFLRYALTPEDRAYVSGLEMPAWKLGKLISAYSDYYGIEERVERLQRQARFNG